MEKWSGVQILGRDSSGPIVNMHAYSLDIDASLDVAEEEKKEHF